MTPLGEMLATGLLSGAAAGKVKQFYTLAEELRGLAATSSVAELIRELIRPYQLPRAIWHHRRG